MKSHRGIGLYQQSKNASHPIKFEEPTVRCALVDHLRYKQNIHIKWPHTKSGNHYEPIELCTWTLKDYWPIFATNMVHIFTSIWIICHTLHKTDYRDRNHSKFIITELSDYIYRIQLFWHRQMDCLSRRGLSFVTVNSCVSLKGFWNSASVATNKWTKIMMPCFNQIAKWCRGCLHNI